MNDEITRGFKAVYCDFAGVKSSCIVNGRSGLTTFYQRGRPASNPNGPLMFFETLDDAKAFVSKQKIFHEYLQIWSCNATNARKCDLILTLHTLSPETANDWWGDRSNTYIIAMHPPSGTWVANTITLVERVDGEPTVQLGTEG